MKISWPLGHQADACVFLFHFFMICTQELMHAVCSTGWGGRRGGGGKRIWVSILVNIRLVASEKLFILVLNKDYKRSTMIRHDLGVLHDGMEDRIGLRGGGGGLTFTRNLMCFFGLRPTTPRKMFHVFFFVNSKQSPEIDMVMRFRFTRLQ